MDRMPQDDTERKLDALFSEYRQAIPDPEVSAGFMPGMWQRVEARRVANLSLFRRVAQVCVGATVALAVLMGVVLIPHMQRLPVYNASYVDVLTANHPNTYVDVLTGDIK